jgi:hypothetical protein
VRHRAAKQGVRRALAGLQLVFDVPLEARAAGSIRNYRVTQPGRSGPRVVVVRLARYDAASNMVTLKLGPIRMGQPVNLTIRGLIWAGVPTSTITATF